MAAQMGADDLDFTTPDPELLREISGIEPEPSGVHVFLDGEARVRSTQRLALGDRAGRLVVAFWPAELKRQALFLYAGGRARRLIAAAFERGWSVKPSPHLAFWNSGSGQRLYMAPDLDPAVYADRWEGPDRDRIGRHPCEAVRATIWPWLKASGYASDGDDQVLERFLSILGRRPVDVRPGLRVRREWSAQEIRALGDRGGLADAVRRDVNAILGAAGEPKLPAAARA